MTDYEWFGLICMATPVLVIVIYDVIDIIKSKKI